MGTTCELALSAATTMQSRYFVLDKYSSSYTFHGSFPIGEVEEIPKTVQQLITSSPGWDSETSFEIRYYLVRFDSKSHRLCGPPLTFPQPDESFDPASEASELKNQIEQIVNYDYLRNDCLEIDLSELGEYPEENLIVVGIGRSAQTLVVRRER